MERKLILTVFFLSAIGLVSIACVVTNGSSRAVAHGPPVEYGYQPLLYNGYVVYYTNEGVPYYWKGGLRIWVPPKAWKVHARHWKAHQRAYRVWYQNRGKHYRKRRYRVHQHPVAEKKTSTIQPNP